MKLTPFFISIIFITALSFKNGEEELYSLEIGKIKLESIEKRNFYNVPISLINNTSDTLYYYTMTCSWQDFYFINNPKFKKRERACEYNSAQIVKLSPKSKTTQVLEIGKEMNTDKKQKFRIGLFLLKSKTLKYQEYLANNIFPDIVENTENRKKYMVWSKEIEL